MMGGLLALLIHGGALSPAEARTGAGTTLGICNCFCQCTAKYCDCETYPDGSSSCDTRCWTCLGECPSGFAGGGVVQVGTREATIAVSATAEKQNKNRTDGAVGIFRWVDPTFPGGGIVLESAGLGDYVILDGPNTRAVTGQVIVNGGAVLPFRLEVTAEPGGGQDTVLLLVGDELTASSEKGFGYSAAGVLVAGDLIGTWNPTAD
jgi:hypothetical protein